MTNAQNPGHHSAEWDFREIKAGKKPTHAFQIANDSEHRVVLSGLRTSCHCLRVVQKRVVLPPGESRRVAVELDTTGLSGKRSFKAFLEADTSVGSLIELVVSVTVVRNTDSAALKVSEHSRDFGAVRKGRQYSHVFTIYNEGKETLTLGSARTSCGACLTIKGKPDEIAPGSTSEVDIILDTSGKRGGITQHAYIQTNDPNQPLLQLTIVARVCSAWTSASEISFGTVTSDAVVKRVAYILTSGFEPATVLSAESDNPSIEVSLVQTGVDKRSADKVDKAFALTATLNASEAPIGPLTSHIVVKTNVPGHERLALGARVHVTGLMPVTPSHVFFGFARPGDTVRRTCRLTLSELEPRILEQLLILSDRPQISALKVLPRSPDGLATLELTFKADSEIIGQCKGEITGSVDEKTVLNIPYSALVKNSP